MVLIFSARSEEDRGVEKKHFCVFLIIRVTNGEDDDVDEKCVVRARKNNISGAGRAEKYFLCGVREKKNIFLLQHTILKKIPGKLHSIICHFHFHIFNTRGVLEIK